MARYTMYPFTSNGAFSVSSKSIFGRAVGLVNGGGKLAISAFAKPFVRRLALYVGDKASKLGLGLIYRKLYKLDMTGIEWIDKQAAQIVADNLQDVTSRSVFGSMDERVAKLSPDGKKLMAGEMTIEQYVNTRYPQSQYPILYTRGPQDLTVPLVIDGYTFDGRSLPEVLGPSSLKEEFFNDAFETAVRESLGYVVLAVIATLFVIAPTVLGAYFASKSDAVNALGSAAGFDVNSAAMALMKYRDQWGPASFEAVKSEMWLANGIYTALHWIFGAGAVIVGAVLACLPVCIFAHIFAKSSPAKSLRGSVWHAAESAAAHFRGPAFERLVRYPWRADAIQAFERSLPNAHKYSGTESTPVFRLGQSTGRLWFRGSLQSPMPGTPMVLSALDITKHMLVMGGTGGGKTSQVAKPMISRVCEFRKAGLPINMYLTDGKAVLYQTLLEQAQKFGIEDDVAIIGTGVGQYRVDLLDGVEPQLFADVMNSVASQLGGGRGDSFWPRMASSLVLQTSVILQAAELTQWGTRWQEQNNARLYSINQIIRYSMDPEALFDGPISAVLTALQTAGEYSSVAELDGPALHNAIEQRVGFWENLADATKSGVWANVLDALQLFLFDDDISRGFADGARMDGYKMLSPMQLFNGGKLIGTSISTAAYGAAGRLVLVMLKTLFMRSARIYEEDNPTAPTERESYWKAPHSQPTANDQLTIYLADEYQDLITVDQNSSYSDASFWNMARSHGVAGVVMFQTLEALKQRIGDDATRNFVYNFRSKVMLPVEDVGTISWFSELLGSSMRAKMTGDGVAQDESYAKRVVISTSQQEPAMSDQEMAHIYQEALEDGIIAPPTFDMAAYNYPHEVHAEHPAGMDIGTYVSSEMFEAKISAIKAEHLPTAELQTPLLDVGDMKDLPMGDAVMMLNRSGIVRADIVNLTIR